MTESLHCFHCGLECDQAITSTIKGSPQVFCCYGCQAVATTIVEGGLGEFYRHRESNNQKAESYSGDLAAFDLPDVQDDFVDVLEGTDRQAHLYISGITCAACVWLIEKQVNTLPGIQRVTVNANTHKARIVYDSSQVLLSQIMAALNAVGYRAQPFLAHAVDALKVTRQRSQLMRLGVAGIGMMQSGMVAVTLHAGDIQGMDDHWVQVLRWVNMLFTLPVILYSAQPFFKAAWRAIKARHLVMDVSVSLALILAFSSSVYATVTVTGEVYFDSVAMFTFFLLLGRYLEGRARLRNTQTSDYLRQLIPLTVTVLNNAGEKQVKPVKQLVAKDRIWVAPGSVFPADGVVVDGSGEVDESLLTGESAPVPVAPDSRVFAGAHNGNCALTVEVTAIGAATQLAAIERLTQNAEEQKPKQVLMADRIAGKFVASVLLIASLAYFVWLWVDPGKAFWVALSVLVVTCPCALSLATPTVLTAAINALRQKGFLITHSHALDGLAAVDTVVLDKTGTLTTGQISLAEVVLLSDLNQSRVLHIAAALEEASSHPIARAFEGVSVNDKVTDRTAKVGEGVSGVIDGTHYRLGVPNFAHPLQRLQYPSAGLWLLLANQEKALAWIRLHDDMRPSAQQSIEALYKLGLGVELLSGDRKENVQSAARRLGIECWRGGRLPGDKLERIKQLQAERHKVFMLGDGINDLPVLSGADVSCAMGSATELARSKADCVLLNDDLMQIPRAFNVAKQTQTIIKQNLGWAVLYNIVALPLAVLGLIPPWLAAIGMSSSSLIVVVNALRVGKAAN